MHETLDLDSTLYALEDLTGLEYVAHEDRYRIRCGADNYTWERDTQRVWAADGALVAGGVPDLIRALVAVRVDQDQALSALVMASGR